MSMISEILPLGSEPNWELEEASDSSNDLHSIADSQVLLHILKQSRERWLTFAFPEFSTRIRPGQLCTNVPAPHTSTLLGFADLVLGPTSFPKTRLYEVMYLPDPESSSSAPPILAGTTPLADGNISSATVAQLNMLAKTNPRVAELLTLAREGHASQGQMRELGVLLQSVVASSSPAPRPELVIEFAERSNTRFYVPKDPAFWSVEPAPSDEENKGSEIWIRTLLHNSQEQVGEPVTIRVREPPSPFVDFLGRWLDRTEVAQRVQHWQILTQQCGPDVYLPLRLKDGELLETIQQLGAPEHEMVYLHPIKALRARRLAME